MDEKMARKILGNARWSGNSVVLGMAVLFEVAKAPAAERICRAVEAVGGEVVSVDAEARACQSERYGYRTVHTVLAILPESGGEDGD